MLKIYYKNPYESNRIQLNDHKTNHIFHRKQEYKITLCEASLLQSNLSFKKRQVSTVFKHLMCSTSCDPCRMGIGFIIFNFKKLYSSLVMLAQTFSSSGNLPVLVSLQELSFPPFPFPFRSFRHFTYTFI